MPAAPSTQPRPPPSSGAYRKLQDLASGGMGSVELARAVSGPVSGQLVALKRLHPHLEREKHFADMFFDEAWITAGLNHPNIARIVDWGQDATGRYLALEFVPGDALLALMREAKRQHVPFPLDIGIYIAAKTAEGLNAAHELRNEEGDLRHLVHRDVSPSNILVSYDGYVKLIDFGVAKARDRMAHTSTGTIKGKFGYMSPEQARGFPVDRRSDVFSMGIVVWEMVAGRRLYRSESELEILRMIVEEPPPSLRTVRPDVPEALDQLVAGALAKNRDDRIGSCGEFAEFLWEIFRHEGYQVGRAEVAAFFHSVLPERHAALTAVTAGHDDFTVPLTMVSPSSGSFPNSASVEQKSGAIPLSVTKSALYPPTEISASHPGISLPASTASLSAHVSPVEHDAPAPKRLVWLYATAGGVGLVAIVAIAFLLGGRSPSATPAAGASAPQSIPSPSTQPLPTIPTPTVGPPTVPVAAAATDPSNPAAATSPTGPNGATPRSAHGGSSRVGTRGSATAGTSATTTVVQTGRPMPPGYGGGPSAVSSAASSTSSTQNSASGTGSNGPASNGTTQVSDPPRPRTPNTTPPAAGGTARPGGNSLRLGTWGE